jgi:hypothetical protein
VSLLDHRALLAALCALSAGACNALWGIGDLTYEEVSTPAGAGIAGSGGGDTTSSGGGGGGGGSGWWNTQWSRRIRIRLDNSARNEGLSNFPVPVVLDPAEVAILGARPDGSDLRAVSAHGELMAHEIELWSLSSGGCVWVLVPAIEADSAAGFFWLYAGNDIAPSTEAPEAVWAGYRAVWHLNEPTVDEGAGLVHADATGNGNAGLQQGNARQAPTDDTLGGSQSFDGVDDFIEVATTGLQLTGTALTLEARAVAVAEPHDWPHVLGAGGDGRYWQIYWQAPGAGSVVGWVGTLRADGARTVVAHEVAALGSWHTLALVYDGAELGLYVDGELRDAAPLTGPLDALDSPLRIGDNPGLSPREFQGVIDEVRIADVARSAAWVEAQHDAHTGAMVTTGAVEAR